jgi:hypothetical protein
MGTRSHLRIVVGYLVARTHSARSDERGMTTTEVAVLTFLLVGAAIAVMGIIYNAATSNANNIPQPG